jgi:hypothetical protein
VEIEEAFHNFLLDRLPDHITLNSAESNLVLSYVAKKLLKLYPNRAENLIISSNRVYRLGYDIGFKMESPFDIFDEAIEVIGITEPEEMKNNSNEVAKQVEKQYEGFDFICEIFPVQLFDLIKGYFCLIDEENIYIMFFSYRQEGFV